MALFDDFPVGQGGNNPMDIIQYLVAMQEQQSNIAPPSPAVPAPQPPNTTPPAVAQLTQLPFETSPAPQQESPDDIASSLIRMGQQYGIGQAPARPEPSRLDRILQAVGEAGSVAATGLTGGNVGQALQNIMAARQQREDNIRREQLAADQERKQLVMSSIGQAYEEKRELGKESRAKTAEYNKDLRDFAMRKGLADYEKGIQVSLKEIDNKLEQRNAEFKFGLDKQIEESRQQGEYGKAALLESQKLAEMGVPQDIGFDISMKKLNNQPLTTEEKSILQQAAKTQSAIQSAELRLKTMQAASVGQRGAGGGASKDVRSLLKSYYGENYVDLGQGNIVQGNLSQFTLSNPNARQLTPQEVIQHVDTRIKPYLLAAYTDSPQFKQQVYGAQPPPEQVNNPELMQQYLDQGVSNARAQGMNEFQVKEAMIGAAKKNGLSDSQTIEALNRNGLSGPGLQFKRKKQTGYEYLPGYQEEVRRYYTEEDKKKAAARAEFKKKRAQEAETQPGQSILRNVGTY